MITEEVEDSVGVIEVRVEEEEIGVAEEEVEGIEGVEGGGRFGGRSSGRGGFSGE